MPQLILEFSANVFEKNNIVNLFEKCHASIAQNLPTDLASCKSRAIENKIYCVGDGSPNNAFIHVQLKVMAGRTLDQLNLVGENVMEIICDHFSASLKKLNLQITLEITELPKVYFKIT